MKNTKFQKRILVVSAVSFFILSLSFLFLPVEGVVSNSVKLIILGVVIWLFLIIGILSQIKLSLWFKKSVKKDGISDKGRIGVLCFLQNTYSTLADIICAVSLIGFIVSAVITHLFGYINYVLLFVLIFSFSMHCILNGKVYNYIIHGQEK